MAGPMVIMLWMILGGALALAWVCVDRETGTSLPECPDCGAGVGEECLWDCSSNWTEVDL